MTALLHITADHRERDSGVPDWLGCDPCVQLAMGQLEVGDYLVAGMAVFERKTVADFARSIVDGRLFRQASRLASYSLPAVVILEGTWPEDDVVEGVDRRAFQGAMISLSVIFRIPLLHSAGAQETAELIRYTAGQMRRSIDGAFPRRGYRPKGKRKRQLHILQSLPGIGPGRAARLLERFGSVEKVFAATPQDLAEVQGIGNRTAHAIRDAVQESRATYEAR
jgi:DNA excision repair protein ERCC-4